MTVGQDQDILGGDFSLGQAFRGLVAQVGMWARQLTPKEILDVSKCDAVQPEGDLLPWGSSIWHVQGRAHVVNVSHCQHKSKQFYPFIERLQIHTIRKRLKILGMTLAVPQKHEEIMDMVNVLDNTRSQCSEKFRNRKYAFINVFYDNTTGTLLNMNSNTTLNHSDDVISEERMLTSGMMSVTNKGKIGRNYKRRGCYFGEYIKQHPIFHLRGLCGASVEGEGYGEFLLSTNSQRALYFVGLSGGAIIQENSMWYLIHRYKNVTLGFTQGKHLPVGRQKWSMNNTDSLCASASGQRSMILSKCTNDEFTCTDGSCVLLSSRCDLEPDCEDWSDEHFCETVALPDGYLSNLPPPPPIGFALNISFSHLEVDLKTMTFSMKINIQLKWYDGRISFLNLRDGTFVNMLPVGGEESTAVWLPNLQLSDMTDQGSFSNPVVYVLKQSKGYLSQDGESLPSLFSFSSLQ